MKYLIRERIFSIGNKFDIENEFGNIDYTVVGRVFTLGKKLTLYRQGLEDLEIEERFLRILPEYEILRQGEKIGWVKKQFSLFSPSYEIYSKYGSYEIKGSFTQHEFDILKDGNIVARISKRYISWSDTYSVDIDSSEDAGFILAILIILDQVHHDGGSKN